MVEVESKQSTGALYSGEHPKVGVMKVYHSDLVSQIITTVGWEHLLEGDLQDTLI